MPGKASHIGSIQLPKVTMPHEPPDNLPDPTPPHSQTGPVSRYTPDLARAILHTIRTTSLPIPQACRIHGVAEGTWWEWYHRRPELSAAYSRAMSTRAVADVSRKAQQWDNVLQDTTHAPDEAALRRVDVYGRNLDRASRYSQWVAERHNPAIYASRALVGVAAISDPGALLASAYGARVAQGTLPIKPSQTITRSQSCDQSGQ